ncbi:MAG: hypothetical protein AAFY65_06090 [Pseudomonadota bacterium]
MELAKVTHGEALQQLSLAHEAALVGGGLDAADWTIHEIKLLSTWVDPKTMVS